MASYQPSALGLRTLLFCLVVFALAGSLAQADTSSTSEVKNPKIYGNCVTSTFVDMFTDKEHYYVECFEETLTDVTAVGIMSEGSRLRVILSKGVQFHLDTHIRVMIRVDQGGLIRRTARWDKDRAVIQDNDLARHLLHELARGQKAVIQVGDEGGNVRLNGSRRAIDDFRQRAGLQPQQTLEIPTQEPL